MRLSDTTTITKYSVIMKTKLKVFRAMHDMTQEDLAQNVKVTRQTINAIEKEKYDPSLELAFKLSKFFKVKIEDIFTYIEWEEFKG